MCGCVCVQLLIASTSVQQRPVGRIPEQVLEVRHGHDLWVEPRGVASFRGLRCEEKVQLSFRELLGHCVPHVCVLHQQMEQHQHLELEAHAIWQLRVLVQVVVVLLDTFLHLADKKEVLHPVPRGTTERVSADPASVTQRRLAAPRRNGSCVY